MRALGIALALALVLRTESVNADLVVRGETATIDRRKLDGLVQLELGNATDVEVIVDVSAKSAAVTLERRGGERRTGIVDLPASGSGDVERTVALFVGELSREQEQEPPAPIPSQPAPTPLPSGRAPDREPRKPRSSLTPSVLVGGAARVFGADGALFLGPVISGGVKLREHWRLSVVGRYAVASTDVQLGSVHAQIASAGPSLAYELITKGTLAVETGVAVDIGWIGGAGEGIRARTTSGFGVAGAGFLEARWAVARPIVVTLALEAGALGPGLELRADNRRAMTASGPFVGTSLGMGFAP